LETRPLSGKRERRGREGKEERVEGKGENMTPLLPPSSFHPPSPPYSLCPSLSLLLF
jgi:hypothetical protein